VFPHVLDVRQEARMLGLPHELTRDRVDLQRREPEAVFVDEDHGPDTAEQRVELRFDRFPARQDLAFRVERRRIMTTGLMTGSISIMTRS
jgi:hypothetical protein